MEIITAGLNLTDLKDTGVFAGIAATWSPNGNGWEPDPGAIAASMMRHKSRGSMPAMLLYHDHQRPVGRWMMVDPKADGIHVQGALALDTIDGGEAYKLLRAGALPAMSLGLSGDLTFEAGQMMPSGRPARKYTKADLHEVSLCTIGADPNALVREVASLSSARDIEGVLRERGVSSRKAKAAATAAWRAIDATAEADTTAIRTILSAASGSLSRFHRSK